MKSKRGVVEVQFNWVFILVVGAIILMFFVVIVQRQEDVSEQKRDVSIKAKFKTILVSAKQSTGTLFVINIPKTEIEYTCAGYSVRGTKPEILGESFSVSLLKSVRRELYLWALDWSIPYKVTNFQYIISPDVRYVIVDDSDGFAQELNNLLPDNVTKQLVSFSDIAGLIDNNNYKIKFIFLDDNPEDATLPAFADKMSDEDVTAIEIIINDACESQTDSVFDGCGNVSFYEKNDDNEFEFKGSYPYLKKESLLGAVFVDSNDTYSCVMKRALTKLGILTEVYLNRTMALYDYYQSPRDVFCDADSSYYFAITRLKSIVKNSTSFNITSVKTIYSQAYTGINNLREINRRRLQPASCPLIY